MTVGILMLHCGLGIRNTNDYHGEHKTALNENDSHAMSSSRFTVNKKLHYGITSIFYVST
jgi:hypothetical protein